MMFMPLEKGVPVNQVADCLAWIVIEKTMDGSKAGKREDIALKQALRFSKNFNR